MAANVARAGFEVAAWNRTPGRAAALEELGSRCARARPRSPRAEIVVTIVSDTPDVEAVLFGDDGVAGGAKSGTLVIDMSTISPSATRDFAEQLAAAASALLDAPVSRAAARAPGRARCRSSSAATRRTSSGPARSSSLGTTITHVGPIGSGQAAKAVNQVILAGTYLGVAEGIVLAIKAGLDVEQSVAALSGGAAQSWVLDEPQRPDARQRLPARASRSPCTARTLASRSSWHGSPARRSPSAPCAEAIEAGLIGQGHADDDMSAVARSIRALSGLES